MSVEMPLQMYRQVNSTLPLCPLSAAFLDPENVDYILRAVSANLTKWFGVPIKSCMSAELATQMIELINSNQGLAYTPSQVCVLNDIVIRNEVRVQFYSLRQKALYYKYFINANRLKVFPYPTKPDGRGTKDVHVETADYMLTNPRKQHRREYLQQVLGICDPKKLCTPCAQVPNVSFPSPCGACVPPGPASGLAPPCAPCGSSSQLLPNSLGLSNEPPKTLHV